MSDIEKLMSMLSLPQDFTRRGFLKVASVTAALAAMNEARAKTGARPYVIIEHAEGLIVGDPNLCMNCQRCELACTNFNDGKSDPKLARIKIGRNMWFGPEGTAKLPPVHGIWGDNSIIQDTCRQCPHPVPCASACPQGAIRVDPKTKARKVDTSLCTGCKLCQDACPWGMMTFDEEAQKASKCFLCDGNPKCVKECPAQALFYIPWKDRTGEAARRPAHGFLPAQNRDQCGACHG